MLKDKEKLRLLHIIPYEKFVPPKNGGALRCYHLCVELSKYYKVTVLTYQNKKYITDFRFKDIEVLNPIKSQHENKRFSKIINAVRYRFLKKTFRGPAQAALIRFYSQLLQLSEKRHYDFVIMEHLETIDMGIVIKDLFPKAIRIADQHNVDHLLVRQYSDLSIKNNYREYKRIRRNEASIHKMADYFFSCSDLDNDNLTMLNDNKIKGFVVPNGTSLKKEIKLDFNNEVPKIIFCGALDTEPNKNGLLWFYKNIWPLISDKIPELKLIVIGKNGADKCYNSLKIEKNIDFIGEVDNVNKYYLNADLAIVPLLEGSGTRLKITEAMSFGVPVISTSIGAEGIDYQENINILIANNPKQFSKKIEEALKNHDKLKMLAINGLKLVNEKYNWSKIGYNTAQILGRIALERQS